MDAKLVTETKEIVTTKEITVGVDIRLTLIQAQYIRSCLGYMGTSNEKELMNLLSKLEALGFQYTSYKFFSNGNYVSGFYKNLENELTQNPLIRK